MSKKSIKKLIICLVAVLLLALVANKVFAQSITDMLTDSSQSTISSGSESGKITEGATSSENKTQKSNLEDIKPAEKTQTESTPTTTPYTGIGDYTVYILIGVFAVSTIFAYKKIREYNV